MIKYEIQRKKTRFHNFPRIFHFSFRKKLNHWISTECPIKNTRWNFFFKKNQSKMWTCGKTQNFHSFIHLDDDDNDHHWMNVGLELNFFLKKRKILIMCAVGQSTNQPTKRMNEWMNENYMQLLFYCINIFNDDDDDNDEILPHNLLPFSRFNFVYISLYIFFLGWFFSACIFSFAGIFSIIIRDRRSGKIFQKKIPEPERQKITKPNQTNQSYRYARIKVKVKSTQPTNQPFKWTE